MRKEIAELLAMFHFASYISHNSGYEFGLPDPYEFLNSRTWSATEIFYYGNSVATYLSNMSQSSCFNDWVRGWNIDRQNTTERQYSTMDWIVLISRWVE